ncbi:MAG: mechanosensitive ion channel family protein [Salinivirgaceae bacterium]
MEQLSERFLNKLLSLGLNTSQANLLQLSILLLILILACFLADIITKRVIVNSISQFIKKSKNEWDDILLNRKVINRIAHLAPALVLHFSINLVFGNYPQWVTFIETLIYLYITFIVLLVLVSLTQSLHEIYLRRDISKTRPIKGYIQLINIFFYFIAIIIIISLVTGNSPGKLLAGLGALAAVLLLVFKDTILGLVASVQLSANNMVRIGDWIEMPSRKADGTILEITLNTVKVQNWDKTIATIPTYAMVSESFTNWRGMEESGGRRIKRSINIDMSSVKFCSPEMIEKFKKIHRLKTYISEKLEELELFNKENQIDDSVLVNGRRLTNLGVFRKYVEEYLKHHPKIHQDMTFLVRQLQANEKGMPIEIYVFSKDQAWANFESIQADLFDHILAILPEFELRVFQNPSSFNVEQLAKNFNTPLT